MDRERLEEENEFSEAVIKKETEENEWYRRRRGVGFSSSSVFERVVLPSRLVWFAIGILSVPPRLIR